MGKKSRFVKAETIKLELSDGDWIEVKARLTYGERQALATGALRGDLKNESVSVDFTDYNINRMATWLVDWSFVNEAGKSVSVSKAAIADLDPDTAEEIDTALTAYIEKLESEKNLTSPGEK